MGVFAHDCRLPVYKGLRDRKSQRHNGEIWECHCGRRFRGRVYSHPSGWRLIWHPINQVEDTSGYVGAHRKPKSGPTLFDRLKAKF